MTRNTNNIEELKKQIDVLPEGIPITVKFTGFSERQMKDIRKIAKQHGVELVKEETKLSEHSIRRLKALSWFLADIANSSGVDIHTKLRANKDNKIITDMLEDA